MVDRQGRRTRARSRVSIAMAVVAGATTVVVLGVPASRPEAATLIVDTTSDGVDSSPGNGICATAAGACTLRAAIQEANGTVGRDTITLPAGTYRLSRAGAAEDLGAAGDLDVTGPVTIRGDGADVTMVDGDGLDRVLHLHELAGDVTLEGLTVTGGETAEPGAGIHAMAAGALRLDGVELVDNHSVTEGGGAYLLTGSLRLVGDSVVAGNSALSGGGVFFVGEDNPNGVPNRVEVIDATMRDNEAIEGNGGGISVEDEFTSLLVQRSTFTGNSATEYGGALYASTPVSIVDSTFEGNRTNGDGGAITTEAELGVTIERVEFHANEAGVLLPGETEAEGSGGAASIGGSGPVTLRDLVFDENDAGGNGGGLAISNNGFVNVFDTEFRNNRAGWGGGGLVNEGMVVNLTRVEFEQNRALLDGGGMLSEGSGSLSVIDSTFHGNTAQNGGGYSNDSDGGTKFERVTVWDNRALRTVEEDSGLGGGIYSLGDGSAEYENVTLTANLAQVRGGGFYVDADAPVHLSNMTISGNSAPVASGLGTEVTIIEPPVLPELGMQLSNSIVAGNLIGNDCNFPVYSLGGNLDGDGSCWFMGSRDRTVTDEQLAVDALADNGGSTMTMALRAGSLAIDGGVLGCALSDQRGVTRPAGAQCDAGAFEFEGPFGTPDNTAPGTFFPPTGPGPVQDTENTSLLYFAGTDTPDPVTGAATTEDLLLFECRLVEHDVAEEPEIPDPTEPPDPEEMFRGCKKPWQVELMEEGEFLFEVRAIDRSGNVDPTPASILITVDIDAFPPDTHFLETPALDPDGTSSETSAAFTIGATDNQTAVQFMEFECRVDSFDPEDWLECTNPYVVSNLAPGEHTVQARATDAFDNIDPSPATFTWTVVPGPACESGNIALSALGDTTLDESEPEENRQSLEEVLVRSSAPGEDARTLIEFALPSGTPAGCELEKATLRLAGEGDPGRTLAADPTVEPWSESQATWLDQPATAGTPVTTSSGHGYRSWDVTARVRDALAAGEATPGWLIYDQHEEDPEGAEQQFISSEAVLEPPMPPQLVLRFEDSGTPPPAPPADPSGPPVTLECGAVVTESVRLAADVTGCLFEGLVIGAPNIVLDLNGHAVRGGALVEPGEEDGLLAGIRNSGHDNVVIRNGTIENFGYGVRLVAGATYNRVTGLTLKGNVIAGVELYDADDGRHGNVVEGNRFELNGDGVAVVFGSEGSVIRDNEFRGNLGRAVYLFDAAGNRIVDNFVSGETGDPLLDSDGGFYLESSSDNVLARNTVADTGDAAFVLTAGSHDNRIEDSTSTRTSDAAVAIDDSDGTAVVDNIFHMTGGAAISLGSANGGTVAGNDVRFNPGGVELLDSSGTVIDGNDASYSFGDGIAVEDGLLNTITDNTVVGGEAAGIAADGDALDPAGNPANGNVFAGNTTSFNDGDGIAVAGAGHTIEDNQAHGNAAWGITADAPNVNGGNVASGNGEPLQCEGVTCSAGTAPPPPAPDLEAPATDILDAPPDGSSTLATQAFTFTGTDNLAPVSALRYECRLDAPPDPPAEPPEPGEPPEPPDVDNWEECGNPARYALLTTGEHTFEVRAIDPFENIDLTPATYTWTVIAAPAGPDDLPPGTTLSSTPPDPSASTDATFAFRGSDNQTPGPFLTYECSTDGGAFAACESPFTVTELGLGDHHFEVRAVDLAGNTDPTPAAHDWTVVEPEPDESAPETIIESGPDAATVATSAELVFSSDEDPVTFECEVDAAGWEPCTAPLKLTALTVGTHTVQIRAIDAALNTDPSPATYAWTITEPPVPTALSCGDVVTHSVLLTNDLVECGLDGIVVGADAITIDLDGHTVSGTATELGAGIRNEGHDSVTIGNGVVSGFEVGVLVGPGASAGIVSDLTLVLSTLAGIELRNADQAGVGNTVRHNTITGGGLLVTSGTEHADIHDNLVTGDAEAALWVFQSHRNTITRNEFSQAADTAVRLEAATFNQLSDNTVLASGDAAFELIFGSDDNVLERNQVASSEGGVIVDSSHRNTLTENLFSGAGDLGIDLQLANDNVIRANDLRFNSGGLGVEQSSRNLIEANDVSFGDGTGIEVGDLSFSNIIRDNLANGGSEGISVGATTPAGSGNVIDGNIANGNDGDGISVPGLGNVIVRNTANGNMGWGIWSELGNLEGVNVDGGGNRATGNVELEQCHGIVCNGSEPMAPDTTAPNTWVITGPVGPTLQDSGTIRFGGSDNATPIGFECRIDSTEESAFQPCVSPHTVTGLAAGEHTFEVRAVDYFSNRDESPATHAWTIEEPPPGVAPDTTVERGPDQVTVATTGEFTFGSNEPGVTYECRLDAAAFAPCANPHAATVSAPGSHTLEVRAVDAEELVDESPAAYTWLVTAAPVPLTVSCGQLLTQSTLVLNDLTDCGTGLRVGAAGITIDLGGRTIDGNGSGTGVDNPGFASVLITNGNLQWFDHGVSLGSGAQRNIVSGVVLNFNEENGVAVNGANDVVVRDSVFFDGGRGLGLYNSHDAHVHHNTFTEPNLDAIRVEGGGWHVIEAVTITMASEYGIAFLNANGNAVRESTVIDSGKAAIALGDPSGARSHDNYIERNELTLNSSSGIEVHNSSGNDILSNVISDSGAEGIELRWSHWNVIDANDLRFNQGAIALYGSYDNQIIRNDAGTSNGTGVRLEQSSLQNTVADNRLSGNSDVGIYVADDTSPANGNLLLRNTASANGSMGINVNGTGHTLTGNIAELNDGWGIFAKQGTIDGGGNTAAGNMEPAQCSGVTCIVGVAPGSPNTTLVLKPTNPSSSSRAVFTFTGSDDSTPVFDLEFECRLDSTSDTAWQECENPWEIAGLSPGPHRAEVRAVDGGELVDPSPAVYEWVYNSLPGGEPPETFIGVAPPLETPAFEGWFTFSSDDPDATFECQMDSGLWEACAFAYEFEFEVHEAGVHTFRVRATDLEVPPLTDPTPAVHTWTISGAVATITDAPAWQGPPEPGEGGEGGETEDRTATFTFEANVADSTFRCSLDLGPFVSCNSGTVTYSGLAVGEHLFRVYAISPEGAEQIEATEYEWTIIPGLDTAPPVAFVTHADTDANGALRFAFGGTDNVTSPQGLEFECRLVPLPSGAPIELGTCASPLVVPNLELPEPIPPGQYRFEVLATDAEENVSDPGLAVLTYAGDTLAPAAPAIVPVAAETGSLETLVTFSLAGDPNVTFECSLVPVTDPPTELAFEECESPHTVQADAPGGHEFAVRAVDLSGNVGPPATAAWTVVGPPVVTFTGPLPPTTTPDTSATFAFAADQAGLTFTCKLDGPNGDVEGSCTSPVTYTDLNPGEYTLEVSGVNVAFGLTAEAISHTWTVEGEPVVPPVVTILDQPEPETWETTATFAFAADQLGVEFMCSFEPPELPAPVFTSCESPVTHSGLTVGIEYTFSVYGVISGVAGEAVSVEWEVVEPPDTTPPDTSFGAGVPPAVTTATSATFSFAATEPGSSFLCSLDSAEPAECSSPVTLSALSVGLHTFSVAGRDAAGNVDATPVSHSWEVQAAPPDCSAVATLTATADSWVDRASTADTNGSETVLRVRSRSSNRQRRALVGFALPTSPPGCEVATATLRLYASSSQSGRTLRAEALAGPWTEAAVNWSNQPAVTDVFSTTSSGSGWRTWNVAPHVGAALTGGPNFGFLVRDAVETSDHEQQFTSREGTADRRPQLVLTYEVGSGSPPTTTTTTSTTTTTAPPTTTTSTTTAPPTTTTTTTAAPTTTSTTTTTSPTTTAPTTTTTTTTTTSPPSTCAATTVTLSATGDSWIDSGSPSQRKGDDSNLKVFSKSGANNRALVRFALPAVPAGCVVKAATLRLYAKSYRTGRTLQAYALGGPWTEADVTWANQPPTTGSAATTASGSGWRQWNVLTHVTGMYAGPNNGFLVRDATENNDHEQQFDSREASNKPQLVIQFGAP